MKSMNFNIGFSPCPNDTFIFDALVNGKIDTGEFGFTPVLEDVQTLNEWALQERLDITKLSLGVYPLVLEKYKLLDSGSAMGSGVGPLVITFDEDKPEILPDDVVAIPGINTTANLLFSIAYPQVKHKVFLRYDEIENYVSERKGPGVIIHENRFTFREKGLHLILDLGAHWESTIHTPIPLGGIVVRHSIPKYVQDEINRLIRKSIEYSFSNYPKLDDYVRHHAMEMSDDVMRKHIDLYVNDYTLDLGVEGHAAVQKLIETFNSLNQPAVTS